MKTATVLIVDDERSFADSLKFLLEKKGLKVITAYTSTSVLNIINNEEVDTILMDLRLDKENGFELSRKILARKDIPIIIVTAYGGIEEAVASIKAGLFDFISKPFNFENLMYKINKALYYISCKQKIKEQHFEIAIYPEDVQEKLCIAVRYSIPVLLTGETGTGKTYLANYIHLNSDRKHYPFIHIEVSAIPEGLFEAELFGFKKGTFTNALNDKPGLFELANKGTLFLDDIDCLSYNLQAKLLDVLESKKVKRLGDIREINVDFRLIAATNASFEELKEKLRKDLFYRINVIHINIPPLREIKHAIMPLAYYFIEQVKKDLSKDTPIHISEDAEKMLLNYNYPGNIRELKNIITYAVAKNEGVYLAPKDLPDYMVSGVAEKVINSREIKKIKRF
jgi:DNA-binding NtrC family response regulator